MPLIHSASKKAMSANIAELHHANDYKAPGKKRSEAQMAAIAYSIARRVKHGK